VRTVLVGILVALNTRGSLVGVDLPGAVELSGAPIAVARVTIALGPSPVGAAILARRHPCLGRSPRFPT
jgi:hypothetical protein